MKSTKAQLVKQVVYMKEAIEDHNQLAQNLRSQIADLNVKLESNPRAKMLENALRRRDETTVSLLEARDHWKESATLLLEAMMTMAKARRADRVVSRSTDGVHQVVKS